MKKIKTYDDLLLEREKNRNNLIREEFLIRELTRSLRGNLSMVNVKNELIEKLLERPEIIVRTGMLAYSIVREIRNRKQGGKE
jgi:hypothetical protein